MFEETTGTLLCGDLFTRLGGGPPLTGNDIVGPAMEAEDFFALTSLGPATAPNIRKLTELKTDHACPYARFVFSGGHSRGT